jgi:hypothetical protein
VEDNLVERSPSGLHLDARTTTEVREDYKLNGYFAMFEADIVAWVCEAKENGVKWVQEAIRLDTADAVAEGVNNSSSLLDVLKMVSNVIDFFDSFAADAWEPTTRDLYATQVADCICHVLSLYGDLVLEKLIANKFYDDIGRFDISKELCIMLNNITTAIEKLDEVKNDLGVKEIEERYQSSGSYPDGAISPTVKLFEFCEVCLKESQDKLARAISRSVSFEMSQFLREALKTIPADATYATDEMIEGGTGPVLDYLESNLISVTNWLCPEVMELVLILFWSELNQSMYDVVLGTAEHPVDTATRGQMVLIMLMMKPFYDFFYLDGDGLPEGTLKASESYKHVKRIIDWANNDTDYMLANYYKQLALHAPAMTEADTGHHSGHLTVQIGLTLQQEHPEVHVVHVTVLSATNLPAMDSNGLDDPYCVVDLFPSMLSNMNAVSTKVIKKTRDPVWNETFDFVITGDITACVVRIQVWDKDRMSHDDPLGEASVDAAVIKASLVQEEADFAAGKRTGKKFDSKRKNAHLGPTSKLSLLRTLPDLADKSCPQTLGEAWKLLEIRSASDKVAKGEVKQLKSFYSTHVKEYTPKESPP